MAWVEKNFQVLAGDGYVSVKICFLITGFPRYDGDIAGVFVYRLAKYLIQHGAEIRVVAPGDANSPTKEVVDGVIIKRFTYFLPRKWQLLAYGWGIPENLKRNPVLFLLIPFFMAAFLYSALKSAAGCDIIHGHWLPSGLVGLLASRLTGKPLVVTVRHTVTAKNMIYNWLSRIVLKNADQVLSPSVEIKENLGRLGVKSRVIPNPIDKDKFNPRIDPSSAREEFRLSDATAVVTFVGRLSDFKDPVTFIQSIPLVLRKKSGIRFFLVGDGVLRPKLERMVDELGIRDQVIVTGMRGDIHRILSISDFLVAISPFENVWSNTIAEAMQMDVPCILSDAGHTREVFTHLQDCYIVPRRDPGALASAILALLVDPVLRGSLVKQARRLLEEHGRNNAQVIAAHLDVYRSLTGRRG